MSRYDYSGAVIYSATLGAETQSRLGVNPRKSGRANRHEKYAWVGKHLHGGGQTPSGIGLQDLEILGVKI